MSNKTLNLDDSLSEYCLALGLRESGIHARLREQTAKHPNTQTNTVAQEHQGVVGG